MKIRYYIDSETGEPHIYRHDGFMTGSKISRWKMLRS
jgi:hypothetical protein